MQQLSTRATASSAQMSAEKNPKKRPRWERVDQTKTRGRPTKVPQYILHSGDTSSDNDSDDNISIGMENQEDAQKVESSDEAVTR